MIVGICYGGAAICFLAVVFLIVKRARDSIKGSGF